MSTESVLRELPDTYAIESSTRGVLAVHRAHVDSLRRSGFGLTSEGDVQVSQLTGRVPVKSLATSSGTLIVKRYSHGGMFRWLLRDRYMAPDRPFQELVVSKQLAAHGLATPEVIAARAQRRFVGWELSLLTRRVDGAMDAGDMLRRFAHDVVSPRVRTRALTAIGAFIARFHDAGLWHADLHPKNLLVNSESLSGADVRVWVIDLDRSRWCAPMTDERRLSNLVRLCRYVERRNRDGEWKVSLADYARFLKGYAAGRRHWRSDWSAIRLRYRRELPRHELGWLLEGWLSRRRSSV